MGHRPKKRRESASAPPFPDLSSKRLFSRLLFHRLKLLFQLSQGTFKGVDLPFQMRAFGRRGNRWSERRCPGVSPGAAPAPPRQTAPAAAAATAPQPEPRRIGESGPIVAGAISQAPARGRTVSHRSRSVSSWHCLLLSAAEAAVAAAGRNQVPPCRVVDVFYIYKIIPPPGVVKRDFRSLTPPALHPRSGSGRSPGAAGRSDGGPAPL